MGKIIVDWTKLMCEGNPDWEKFTSDETILYKYVGPNKGGIHWFKLNDDDTLTEVDSTADNWKHKYNSSLSLISK